eukprot:762337-Pelagomonas_calceolata.AAC.1
MSHTAQIVTDLEQALQSNVHVCTCVCQDVAHCTGHDRIGGCGGAAEQHACVFVCVNACVGEAVTLITDHHHIGC